MEYSELLNMCKCYTNNSDLYIDLANHVYLIINTKQIADAKIVSAIVYREFYHYNSEFYRLYRQPILNNFVDESCTPNYDEDDIFDCLNELELLWITEWKKRNCSIKRLADHIGANPKSVRKKINKILEKIRYANNINHTT